MTRKLVIAACLLLVFSGCDSLKQAIESIVAQASSESPLGVSTKVEVTPVNADQVARFADEAELPEEEPVRLVAPVTNVAEEPGAKRALVVLPREHEVTKIAKRGDAFLVVFQNPQNQEENLMGWVQKSAFEEDTEAPVQVSSLKCGAGLDKLAGNPEFCARVCSFDDGCEGTDRCTGVGQLSEDGTPGRNVKFCVPKLEQKKEFVQKQAKTTIKRTVKAAPTSTVVPLSERCSPTCTATCDCAGRLRKCSPTCTSTCDCAGRPIVKAEARCSPTCTATCDCAGRPRKCSPTCTSTCDCSGNPIVKAEVRCSPTCTATCDCAGRPRKCSPTCTSTCDCSGNPIVKAEASCSPTCTATCDCAGRPRKCSPTCTSTCDCSGNPIVKAEVRCSPTCTATCDCAGRPRKCSPTCTSTCDCSGNPIVAEAPPVPTNKISAPKAQDKDDDDKKKKKKKKKKSKDDKDDK